MKKYILHLLLTIVTTSAVSVHAHWADRFTHAAAQFTAGFGESAQQEVERRSGTIVNRARLFFNNWLPNNRNIDDETVFVNAGRAFGHVLGYAGAWLAAVDQPDEERFRAVALRCAGVCVGLYIVRKLVKSDKKTVVHVS